MSDRHRLRLTENNNTWQTGELSVLIDEVLVGVASTFSEVIFLVRLHYPKADTGEIHEGLKEFFDDDHMRKQT